MGRLDFSSFPLFFPEDRGENLLLEISTRSFARGHKSLKIYGTDYDALTSTNIPDSPALLSPSIHSNFDIIDDFHSYAPGLVSPDAGGWNDTSEDATFEKTFDETKDYSYYNGISLWGKSEYDVCLYVSYEDGLGQRTNWSKFGYLPKRWKRMDCSISYSEEFDITDIQKILFKVDAEPTSEYFIDEIIAFGFDEYYRNKQWIPLLITDLSTKVAGRTSIDTIAGYLGDVVHQDGAQSRRGNMIFKTGHKEMDNDVRFIDRSRRAHTKLFLRVGGEGLPLYLTNYKQTPEETIFGVRNEMRIEYIEAE